VLVRVHISPGREMLEADGVSVVDDLALNAGLLSADPRGPSHYPITIRIVVSWKTRHGLLPASCSVFHVVRMQSAVSGLVLQLDHAPARHVFESARIFRYPFHWLKINHRHHQNVNQNQPQKSHQHARRHHLWSHLSVCVVWSV